MEPLIAIDGSAGEGGGQILRTSLALSLVTGRPFRIERIRAGRPRPGLLSQHLTAVTAAAAVGAAALEGAAPGSRTLTFRPCGLRPGALEFAVGTAGSTALVLQTVLPALLTAPGPSTLRLQGGTHNPFAPPFEFLERTFLPLVRRMGPGITAELVRPGFYPAGGGEAAFAITPTDRLGRLDLLERGRIVHRRARALVARLPRRIAEREIEVVRREMAWGADEVEIVEVRESRGPGNIVSLEIGDGAVTEVITTFGERGAPAEQVAREAARKARRHIDSGAPVGEHLADQILVPLAIAGGGSFLTTPLSRHATTNVEVIRRFLDVRIGVRDVRPGAVLVEVGA